MTKALQNVLCNRPQCPIFMVIFQKTGCSMTRLLKVFATILQKIEEIGVGDISLLLFRHKKIIEAVTLCSVFLPLLLLSR